MLQPSSHGVCLGIVIARYFIGDAGTWNVQAKSVFSVIQ